MAAALERVSFLSMAGWFRLPLAFADAQLRGTTTIRGLRNKKVHRTTIFAKKNPPRLKFSATKEPV